jgi:tetratricopeptide (TPR) repeat protein
MLQHSSKTKGSYLLPLTIMTVQNTILKNHLNLKEKIQSLTDPSLATSFMNYSRFLLINGELTEALGYITKAERIYLSSLKEDHPDLALLYLNKGSVLILLNRFEEALTYLELSYRIKLAQQNPDDLTLIKLYNNLGVVYENLGNYAEAIKFHKASLANNLDPVEKVKSLRWLASCYANIDSFKKLMSILFRSNQEANNSLGENHWQTAATYHSYGSFLNANDDMQKSLFYLEKSLGSIHCNFRNKKPGCIQCTYFHRAPL